MDSILDNVIVLTLLLIFLSAILTTYLRRRSRDRCLKSFDGFDVNIEFSDDKQAWGRLSVYSNALELVYRIPHQDSAGHVETSFIILQDQLAGIRSLQRFHLNLNAKLQRRRLREIERKYHPGILRRLWRHTRNFFNTFRDALNQALSVVVAQAKKSGSGGALAGQDKHLKSMGETVLGATANAYEPVLERYVGHKVVVEQRGSDEWVEYCGILGDYTSCWLQLLDTRLLITYALNLSEWRLLDLQLEWDVRLTAFGEDSASLDITIKNVGDESAEIVKMLASDVATSVDKLIAPGREVSFSIHDLPSSVFNGRPQSISCKFGAGHETAPSARELPDVTIVVRTDRIVDLCLPRVSAVVRHGGE